MNRKDKSMYHNILTQKEQPNYRAVKKIVKLLVEFVQTDSIYFSKTEDRTNLGILTVLSKKSTYYYDEIREHLEKLIENHSEFSFCIFDRDLVKRNVKEGNLFFILNCKESDLVYSKDNFKPVINIANIKLKRLLRKTRERFKERMTQCETIGRDLKHHNRCDNHLMALYVIHQQFRYMFINISWLVSGERRFENSIKGQQEYIIEFNNSLGKVFDKNKKEEWVILKKLDRACRAVQWGEEIEPLDMEVVAAASEKLEWMKNAVNALFREHEEKTRLIFKDYGNR